MGIPSFYRWLLDRYPLSVVSVEDDPNGVEYDNLYLDMNGIIHPCFHPENLPSPECYDEVFRAVFNYIDRIFSLIRPRKLIYMAIDGVAPRAKMNQQRARRFRAAKDAAEEASTLDKQGGVSLSKRLDSNVITPGTGFMAILSSALQYYIHLRMNKDSGWKGIKVILSDASVPGEGEHKIMSYIRSQRNLPGFDPNTRHCLYGLDADLIMLALATHEVHFSVLREDVQKEISKSITRASCRNLKDLISRQKFQFLNIWILREYLAESLRIPDQVVEVDLERLIDDFVFMCLFVGNDFLPHVPSLEISEGAIDLLIAVYKKEFIQMGGYLTDSSEVNLGRVEHFVRALASHENAIFKKRKQEQNIWKPQRQAKKNCTQGKSRNSNTPLVVDKVNLGEDGWKKRYYAEKFEVQNEEDCERVREHAVLKYVEGICWVMHYYYQGVCSWQWFYPYHYAPFASDFTGLDLIKVQFVSGEPFKPFNQLMGVLPTASARALPLLYRNLMTDPSSPIWNFYPSEFEVDLNGHKQSWKGVCKLPFIDEGRLLDEIAKVEHTLTDAEKQRNSLGLDKLFVHMSNPLAVTTFAFLEQNADNPELHTAKLMKKIDPKLSGGMNGFICISDKVICPGEISSPLCDMKRIVNNRVILFLYKLPQFHPHIPTPPEGTIMPEKSIKKRDLVCPAPTLWHDKTAIGERRHAIRPLPSAAVAGPQLAKLARQLIAQILSSSRRDVGEVCKLKQNILNEAQKCEDHGKHRKRKRKRKRNRNTRNDILEQNISNGNHKGEDCREARSEENGALSDALEQNILNDNHKSEFRGEVRKRGKGTNHKSEDHIEARKRVYNSINGAQQNISNDNCKSEDHREVRKRENNTVIDTVEQNISKDNHKSEGHGEARTREHDTITDTLEQNILNENHKSEDHGEAGKRKLNISNDILKEIKNNKKRVEPSVVSQRHLLI